MDAGPVISTKDPRVALNLPIARYRLRFKPPDKGGLTGYTGSAWRGAMGHALRKAVCVTRMTQCPPCLLYRSCPYPYVFETPPPLSAQKMRKYTAAPHPFVLDLPFEDDRLVHSDDRIVGLTLVGRANLQLPYMIHAFQKAGEEGLGKRRIPMLLQDVSQFIPPSSDTCSVIYEAGGVLNGSPAVPFDLGRSPSALRIQFETPLRLQRDEHLVRVEDFRFSDLFGALLRRISMLTYFHTDTPLETDFADLVELGRKVVWLSWNLEWKDWTRYSSRQKTLIEMGGIMGEVSLQLEENSPLWPFLWVGQWVHAGKGTSMGLGKYRISPASLPEFELKSV